MSTHYIGKDAIRENNILLTQNLRTVIRKPYFQMQGLKAAYRNFQNSII